MAVVSIIQTILRTTVVSCETSGHFLYKKKFTQSEAYPDMDIIADWLIWIVVNIQWEFEIKLKFDWLSLSNKYLYCFVEGRRTQKHQELRLKAVLRAYFIADRPWHFFENIKTIGGSKNCIWGGGSEVFVGVLFECIVSRYI